MKDINNEHKLLAIGLTGLVISLLPTILLFLHANKMLSPLDGHVFKATIFLSFGGAILTSMSIGMAIKNKTIAVAVTPFVALGVGILAMITNGFSAFAY